MADGKRFISMYLDNVLHAYAADSGGARRTVWGYGCGAVALRGRDEVAR